MEDKTRIIGIDPGKTGAIVCITPGNPQTIEKWVVPTIGKELDLRGLVGILQKFVLLPVHVYIEDVHAIFGSAAGATFTFGFVCGAIQGIVAAAGFKYTLVQPKAWQKEIYQGIPEIRKPSIRITKGKRAGKLMQGKLDTKAMSLLAAKRLFPDVDLTATERSTKPHEGIVDALLIAEYGSRRYAYMRGE